MYLEKGGFVKMKGEESERNSDVGEMGSQVLYILVF